MFKFDSTFAYHRLSHSGVGTRELDMVRSRGLRPANGASCAVGPMMLIFFLGAAQAVPLYKMNNEIVNDNNSILDSDLHNLAFADSDTTVVDAPYKQPSPPYMTPCPAYIDNLPETPHTRAWVRGSLTLMAYVTSFEAPRPAVSKLVWARHYARIRG